MNTKFESWPEVLAYAKTGGPLYYQAPMDHHAQKFTPRSEKPYPYTYEVRARTIKMWPWGSFGRGHSRTSDPFTADSGHLERFSRPAETRGVGEAMREKRAPVTRETSVAAAGADKRAVDFFRKHAGHQVGRKEEGAKALAHAEQEATARGWTVDWEDDPEGMDSIGDIDPSEVKECLVAILRDENGQVLGSLGSIINPDRVMVRLTGAELALEALPSGIGETRGARIAAKSRLDGGDSENFRKFLETVVVLVGGEVVDNNSIDPNDEDPVSVAIVCNVTGHGRHPGAISATQGGHADSALETAHEILEEWEQKHYGDDISTETFDGRTWEMPVAVFVKAIQGTEAAKFIEVN